MYNRNLEESTILDLKQYLHLHRKFGEYSIEEIENLIKEKEGKRDNELKAEYHKKVKRLFDIGFYKGTKLTHPLWEKATVNDKRWNTLKKGVTLSGKVIRFPGTLGNEPWFFTEEGEEISYGQALDFIGYTNLIKCKGPTKTWEENVKYSETEYKDYNTLDELFLQ